MDLAGKLHLSHCQLTCGHHYMNTCQIHSWCFWHSINIVSIVKKISKARKWIFSLEKNVKPSDLKNTWLLNWFHMICLWLKIMLFIFMKHKVSIFSLAKYFACMCSLNKKCFINHRVIHWRKGDAAAVVPSSIQQKLLKPTLEKRVWDKKKENMYLG